MKDLADACQLGITKTESKWVALLVQLWRNTADYKVPEY